MNLLMSDTEKVNWVLLLARSTEAEGHSVKLKGKNSNTV